MEANDAPRKNLRSSLSRHDSRRVDFAEGGTGFFIGADGTAGNVQTFHHPHGRYLAAFRKAGLEVVDCVEPPLEREDLAALSGGLVGLAEEAFRSAWVGIPNALVFELVSL